MNINAKNDDRHLIPRWRDYNTTVKLCEIGSASRHSVKVHPDSEDSVLEKRADWVENKTLPFALDLVSSALVNNVHKFAEDAAHFIIKNTEKVSSLAIKQAEQILGIEHYSLECLSCEKQLDLEVDNLGTNINKLRKRLFVDPHDSIAWADLSREYAIKGMLDKAVKSMDIAFKLASENRFILRAASRLYMHADDMSKAHYILKNSPLVKVDPWIMASEISVASVMKRNSQNIKLGRAMLSSDNYAPLQLTELTSELGTLEFYAGDLKNSKKLFKRSLFSPNDNSMAQAVWMSRIMPALGEEVNERDIDLPCSYEAKAFQLVHKGEWENALAEVVHWITDLSFSSRPAVLGSYIASTALENYKIAEKITKFGLRANPKDYTLLNNLTFSLIHQDKIDEAEKLFFSIKYPDNFIEGQVTYNATQGLIMFRKNQTEAGRELYNKGIAIASKLDNTGYKAIATIYLALEEIRIRSEVAKETFIQAMKLSKDKEDPYIKLLFKRLIRAYSETYQVHFDDLASMLKIN